MDEDDTSRALRTLVRICHPPVDVQIGYRYNSKFGIIVVTDIFLIPPGDIWCLKFKRDDGVIIYTLSLGRRLPIEADVIWAGAERSVRIKYPKFQKDLECCRIIKLACDDV